VTEATSNDSRLVVEKRMLDDIYLDVIERNKDKYFDE